MSEHYIPPPPPYQPSIRGDQGVTAEAHIVEPSKTDSSQDERWNDSKYSMALSDKALKDAALHSISKYPTKLDGANLKTRPRPLPSRPVDPPRLREQVYKLDSIAEIKSHGGQNDHKLRSTASMSFPPSSVGEPTHRLSSSVQPSPLHYSPQSSYDTPRRTRNDRRPVPGYPSIDPGVESSFRRSSHAAVQPPPHGFPQKSSFGMRLSFDPSVAYSDSQASSPTTLSTRREAAASLYASAVSSHLPLDYPTTYGSRQPYVSMRSSPLSDEGRRDNSDWQSLRSPSSHPPDFMSSRTSLYSLRPKTSSGHETRWASSETDITRDIYHR